MKHVITTILFSIVFLLSNAQNIVFFNDIESKLSEESTYFEGFYSLLTEDSIFLGGVYAITYYDPCENCVALCLPENSEIPQYWVYYFDTENYKGNDFSKYLYIKTNDVSYKVISDDQNFYVTLKFIHNNNTVIYFGTFEIEDDVD